MVGKYVYIHTKYEVSMAICIGSRVNQRKVTKWLLLETYKLEWLKINQNIIGVYVHIHTKYKVPLTIYIGKGANKSTKMAAI